MITFPDSFLANYNRAKRDQLYVNIQTDKILANVWSYQLINLGKCDHSTTLARETHCKPEKRNVAILLRWKSFRTRLTLRIIDWTSEAPTSRAASSSTFHLLSPTSKLPCTSDAWELSHKPGNIPDASLHRQVKRFMQLKKLKMMSHQRKMYLEKLSTR